MQTIEATYQVNTPLFLGGAEKEKNPGEEKKDKPAELRLPSFKGALRFWWRALAWAEFDGDLSKIKEKEDSLFGSMKTGQSKLFFRFLEKPKIDTINNISRELVYLAGMGLSKPDGNLTRPAMKNNNQFVIEIGYLEEKLNRKQLQLVERALISLGMFGGLGARSRRGFGSLTLSSLSGGVTSWAPPQNINELKDSIVTLIGSKTMQMQGEPSYSAFCAESRFLLLEGNRSDSAIGLLEIINQKFRDFRNYKNNFQTDHDLVFDYLSNGAKPSETLKRAVFGLPHNYFFRSLSKRDLNVKADVIPNKQTRRASPLLFHIHTIDKHPIGIILFLPSKFLPDNEKLTIKDTSSDRRKIPPNQKRKRQKLYDDLTIPGWQPIHDFIDLLKNSVEFTDVIEVSHHD